MNDNHEFVPLGNTDIHITPLGIGALSWGERLSRGYGRASAESDAEAAFETSLDLGVNFFDTAEAYGLGRSERLIGQLLGSSSQSIVLATKYMPYPWRLWKSSLIRAVKRSLARLKLDSVDLYQIHWPFPPISIETWADGLADAMELGLVRSVGVSNYNINQMRRAHATLVKRGVLLASNQVEYNLLNRRIETNGLLSLCKELQITLIAYSPLAQGILTGKYTPDNPPPGIRGYRYNRKLLTQMQSLIRHMREIGNDHDGKTPAQVALNWVICKGAVPIPGAKNAKQAQDNIGALEWHLTDDEVASLEKTAGKIQ